MLKPEDRDAIDGLFDRIQTVAAKSGPRDADAEALIRERLQQASAAPYYMAQTILVQEHAMQMAERRIAELEARADRQPANNGFLGGLFGGNEPQRARRPERAARGPWGDRDEGIDNRQRGGGSGFLAGAAQTALGVTTGVLLGSAIAGMMTGGANADEYNADQPADEPPADDQQADDFDTGNDDFDVGGDF